MGAVSLSNVTDDRLNSETRQAALQRMRATTADSPLDVLVIGGGVVGTGAALDAAARGLNVGLIERRDLASGTSSRSSRLAHGGLRYLEQFEFGLVHEALTERGLLLDRLAPHLVHPVSFLLPVTRKGWERPYMGAGVAMYDLLSRVGAYGGTMPRPRSLSAEKARAVAPGLNPEAFVSAVRFHDAQIDDARHTVACARTAAGYGAAVATDTEAIGFLEADDRVVGVQARDRDTGEEFDIYAQVVVSATGVWSDQLVDLLGEDVEYGAHVRQSKGIHLVVPWEVFPSSSALIARTASSVLFMLPWGDNWLIGTTDTDYDGEYGEPTVTDEDVQYLIDQANKWLATPLTAEQVIGVYAGLRPLLEVDSSGGSESTSVISREHAVLTPRPGFVLIAGGKYTTYRVMAEDVIDAAVKSRAEIVDTDVPDSTTAEIPLVGAAGFSRRWADRDQLARQLEFSPSVMEGLLHRHGDRIDDVLELMYENPELAEPFSADLPYRKAEAVIAIRHEGARSLGDILVRRTRAAMETADGGEAAARGLRPIMAAELGWDDKRFDMELATLLSRRDIVMPPLLQEASPIRPD